MRSHELRKIIHNTFCVRVHLKQMHLGVRNHRNSQSIYYIYFFCKTTKDNSNKQAGRHFFFWIDVIRLLL